MVANLVLVGLAECASQSAEYIVPDLSVFARQLVQHPEY